MKRIICMVMTLVALLAASPAAAHEHGHGGHFGFRGSVWVGPAFGPWWWGPPYPYYAPPVIIQQQPPIYVDPVPQTEEPTYWYYCPDAKGYYPSVTRCPKGWLKVIPSPPPSVDEPEQ